MCGKQRERSSKTSFAEWPHSEWLSATKKLVDPEALKPISKITNAARGYLKTISLPFPLPAMVFVPKEMISRADARLQEFKCEFERAVDEFMMDYGRLRGVATTCLGDLFNELDYPVDIRQKFGLAWRFIVLDLPNGKSGILSPQIYKREKEKFIRTMDEAREMAIASLREEFATMVEHLTERFSTGPDGKPKVFKNSTVNGFYDYFQTFKERNIFRDGDLAELVNRAQAILGGVPAEAFRSSEIVRERVKSGMAQVEAAMAEILTRPRRKIIMPPDDTTLKKALDAA